MNQASRIRSLIREQCAAVSGVEHAVLLSAGGLVLCSASSTDKADAERLAALSSSLMSLTKAAAQAYGSGWVGVAVISMQRHQLCMSPVDADTSLVMVADAAADTGQISYAGASVAREISQLLDGETRDSLCRIFLQTG
ncbi:roadblock/LC7 domain-containing protein [Streptomyces sp. NPDC055709]